MQKYLKEQIDRAVKSFSIEDDNADFDNLTDYEIEEVKRGVYCVYGSVSGTVQGPSIDSGNYYEPPSWKEYEVEAEVSLLVYTHRRDYEADVELEELDYDREPWENNMFDEEDRWDD